jgi:hypothetical protein
MGATDLTKYAIRLLSMWTTAAGYRIEAMAIQMFQIGHSTGLDTVWLAAVLAVHVVRPSNSA